MTPAPSDTPPGGGPGLLPEWLNFIASIVGSVAWPVVVLALLILFRGEVVKLASALRDRIPSLASVKLAGVEAVWSSAAVHEVTREVDQNVPAGHVREGDAGGDRVESRDTAVRLAEIEPGAGVLFAFSAVEREVVAYLARAGVPWRTSPVVALQQSALPGEVKRLVSDLRKLRNAAAHGLGDITRESALEYIRSARRVEEAIRRGDYDYG